MSKRFLFILILVATVIDAKDIDFADIRGIKAKSNESTVSLYGEMVRPCRGILVQSYSEEHPAVDISGLKNRPLYSMGKGVIKRMFRNQRYGNAIEIQLDNGLELLYAHLENYKTESGELQRGQKVNAGDRVGTMGTTGWSLGIHLHLEITKNGKLIDPEPILKNLPYVSTNSEK